MENMTTKKDGMQKMVLKCGEYKKVGCCHLDDSLFIDVLTALKAGRALADEFKEKQAENRTFLNKFRTFVRIHRRERRMQASTADPVSLKPNTSNTDSRNETNKKYSFLGKRCTDERPKMRLTIPGISDISLMDKKRRKEEEARKRRLEIKNLISESKKLYEVHINETDESTVEVDIICSEGTVMDSRWFKKSAKWLYRYELMKDYMLC